MIIQFADYFLFQIEINHPLHQIHKLLSRMILCFCTPFAIIFSWIG